ncbi:pilus assembly protein PilW [Vibrionales bacterium C3R12]|nr:pilus assembly protein PilW [Vibrionales bacterium C3R12]
MAIKHAVNSSQLGATLIEFMVASLLGAMAISIIGSVFLSGQRVATERSKELLLLQQVSGALQYFKQDIQRAGYDGGGGHSLMLSGAANILHISPDFKTAAYAYQHQTKIRNVAFVFQSGMIKVCDSPSTIVKTVSSAVTGCSSIFEPNQIKVTDFSVKNDVIAGKKSASGLTSIAMSAELVGDPLVNYSSNVEVQQRNWQ